MKDSHIESLLRGHVCLETIIQHIREQGGLSLKDARSQVVRVSMVVWPRREYIPYDTLRAWRDV